LIAGNIREKQKAREAAPPPLPPVDPDVPAPAAKRRLQIPQTNPSPHGEPEPQKIDEPLAAVLLEEVPRAEPPPAMPVPSRRRAAARHRPESGPRTAESLRFCPMP